jgi:hypothetical protein
VGEEKKMVMLNEAEIRIKRSGSNVSIDVASWDEEGKELEDGAIINPRCGVYLTLLKMMHATKEYVVDTKEAETV